jgi:hypothetical protein
LDNVLQTFGPVDCSKGTKHTQNTENFDYGNGVRLQYERNKGNSDNKQIQQIESVSAEGPFVKYKPVYDDFYENLDSEYRRKETKKAH